MANCSMPASVRKRPAIFCLSSGHPQIALGLIIVEGHAQVGDEAQHRLALLAQALDEVVGRGLLDAAFAARWR